MKKLEEEGRQRQTITCHDENDTEAFRAVDLDKLDRNGVSKQEKILIKQQRAEAKKNRTEAREINKIERKENYNESKNGFCI